jgi:hypothetical protein
MINVLWLASWYPNRTDIFTGDFIERHAFAVSAFVKLTVLVVIKDDLLKAGEVEIEKTESTNLVVYKVYYGIAKLGGPVGKKFFHLKNICSFRKNCIDKLSMRLVSPQSFMCR